VTVVLDYHGAPVDRLFENDTHQFGISIVGIGNEFGQGVRKVGVHLVAEMLGFTTRDHVRLVWGDSDIAPLSDEWAGGRTITLQGAAICNAADKMRKDLLARAASTLKVEAAQLQMRDGVISSTEDPSKSVTFAALAKANNGLIRQTGRGTTGGERTSLNKGVGTCFVEVEVDTWTGNWR